MAINSGWKIYGRFGLGNSLLYLRGMLELDLNQEGTSLDLPKACLKRAIKNFSWYILFSLRRVRRTPAFLRCKLDGESRTGLYLWRNWWDLRGLALTGLETAPTGAGLDAGLSFTMYSIRLERKKCHLKVILNVILMIFDKETCCE